MGLFWLGLCALGLVGCASSSGTKKLVKTSPFTKPEELARIQQGEIEAEQLIADGGVRVSEWSLTGPLPSKVGLYPLQRPANELEGALLEAMASSKSSQVRATQGMACVARELGSFMIQHDERLPDDGLRTFMRHRCGVLAHSVSPTWWTLDLEPGQEFDADSFAEEFYKNMKESVAKSLDGSWYGEIGVAFVRHEQKVMVLLARGRRAVTVNSFSMVPGEERLEVMGELHRSVSSLGGAITEGDFDASYCVLDSRVKLPQFRMTCPLNRADEQVIFELYARREGSILSTTIFDQRVWPAGVLKADYVPSTIRMTLKSGGEPTGTREEMYLAYVNRVRAVAGIDALSLASGQSQSVSALLPNFLAASKEEDDVSMNKITMGLMAGWDVDGDILDADFRVAGVSDGAMVSLVEDMFDSPGGRMTLLDGDGSAFAVGEYQEEGSRLGAMMLVYEFLPDETYIRRLARAWRTMNAARKLSKRKPFKRSKKVLSKAEKISARIESGAISYEEGVEQLQGVVLTAYPTSGVSTYTYLTHDLDDFSLHGELLEAKSGEAVVMVTPLKIEGYPWTIYAVVVCFPTAYLKM